MPAEAGAEVRTATAEDAAVVARLLHDFNSEYGWPMPPVEEMTPRLGELIEAGEALALLVGGDLGIAVLRLRESLWSRGRVAYLEELYVVPGRRGEGFGRALMEAAMKAARDAGAEVMELGTSTTDVAARGLYESCGFTNLEDGASMLFYERDL
ncbi:MAG: GNAT family N-acetyltransferase [Solirubrobacterales bacterium]